MSAQSKYYNTGGGALYFAPIVNGVKGTEVAFGQTENVNFSSEIETITHDNTEGEIALEDLSILKKVTGKLAIDTVEISPEMLTKAFLGTNNTSAVSANGTLADLVTFSFDTAYELALKYLTITSVTGSTAGALVLNTDYTLAVDNGVTSITYLSTGSGVEADTITYVTTNLAYNDIEIEAFIESKLEGQLRFVSETANGISYTYTFHKVSILSSGDFMLKATDEFAKLSFEGSMLASELITGAGLSKLFKIEGSEIA